MALYLRHTRGSKQGEVSLYGPQTVSVGRTDGNDLCFDRNQDGEVSGTHARISREEDTYYVEDLQSTNGTYVNGQRISTKTALNEGDEIEFAQGGPKVIFSTKAPTDTVAVSVDQNGGKPGNRTKEVGKKKSSGTSPRPAASVPTSASVPKPINPSPNGRRRMGAATAEYLVGMLDQASQYNTKKLKNAILCLGILFVFISAGLISSNVLQRKKINTLSEKATEIEEARIALEEERATLRQEGEQLQKELGQQAEELKRLETLISQLGKGGVTAHVTDAGKVSVNLPNVLFDYNEFALTEDGLGKINYIADVLKQRAPGKEIFIEGHASHEFGGSKEHNMKLSWARAEAVAKALSQAGLPAETITFQGFGSERPIAANDTEEGRRQNRRVQVIISTDT